MSLYLRPPNLSEEEKIAALIRDVIDNNNPEKFDEIVRIYQNRLFAVAVVLVRSEEDARDIVANTFVAAYQNLKKFRGKSSFFTWLHRICRNFCWEHFRQQKAWPAISLDEPLSGGHDSESEETRMDRIAQENGDESFYIKETVWQALNRLPRYFRRAIILKEIYSFNYKEIAEMMSCSPMTVLTRLHRGRKLLRKELQTSFQEQISGNKHVPVKPFVLNDEKI